MVQNVLVLLVGFLTFIGSTAWSSDVPAPETACSSEPEKRVLSIDESFRQKRYWTHLDDVLNRYSPLDLEPFRATRFPIQAPVQAQSLISVYDRANDDSFQNRVEGHVRGANPGVGYSVALIMGALNFRQGSTSSKVALSADWYGVLTTGRHTQQSGNYTFKEFRNPLRDKEQYRQMRIHSRLPEGATQRSSREEKKGTLLFATHEKNGKKPQSMQLGEVDLSVDQEIFGVVRVEITAKGQGWKEGAELLNTPNIITVFQVYRWDVKVENGQIVDARVRVWRTKQPNMKLVASNFRDDVGECFPEQRYADVDSITETIGGTYSGRDLELDRKLGNLILKRNCLNCHDSGTEHFIFDEDSGRPFSPIALVTAFEAFYGKKVLMAEGRAENRGAQFWDLKVPGGMKGGLNNIMFRPEELDVVRDWYRHFSKKTDELLNPFIPSYDQSLSHALPPR